MQKLIQFSRGEINELQISVQLQKIWALITSNVICYPETQNVNSSSLARLQMMMQFIHSNYPKSFLFWILPKLGISNTDYFCKTFKRMYSLTPTEYRNVKK